MAANPQERTDTVAWAFEQGPDEAFMGFTMASLITGVGLYLAGRRDEGMMVGILGSMFAMMGLMLKLLGTIRHHATHHA